MSPLFRFGQQELKVMSLQLVNTVLLFNKTYLSTAPAVGILRANPFTPDVLK
jgi:hypothetical protein